MKLLFVMLTNDPLALLRLHVSFQIMKATLHDLFAQV